MTDYGKMKQKRGRVGILGRGKKNHQISFLSLRMLVVKDICCSDYSHMVWCQEHWSRDPGTWVLVPAVPLTNCLTLGRSLVCFSVCEIRSTGLGSLQEFFQPGQPGILQHSGGDGDGGGGVDGDDW